MNSQQPKSCAKCSLAIEARDSRTVYQGVDYHQNCFLKLVREQADEERAQRAFSKTGKDQYARTR